MSCQQRWQQATTQMSASRMHACFGNVKYRSSDKDAMSVLRLRSSWSGGWRILGRLSLNVIMASVVSYPSLPRQHFQCHW